MRCEAGATVAVPVAVRWRGWSRVVAAMRRDEDEGVAGSCDAAGSRLNSRRFVRSGRADGSIVMGAVGSRAGGFTLLEIVLVLVLIAAAALLATAAMTGGIDRMRLQTSVKQLAAGLRYTRAQAIATGKPQRFTLDLHGHAWQAPNGRHGDIPPKLGVAFAGAREAQLRRDQGAFVFFADGASTGGRVRLTMKGAAWDIDVAWLTGEISVVRGSAAR